MRRCGCSISRSLVVMRFPHDDLCCLCWQHSQLIKQPSGSPVNVALGDASRRNGSRLRPQATGHGQHDESDR
ncbi:MAG: hypothetical protein KatS3mg111_2476 [Pirellulaceae bacterium]|nr:MAG: hypothetical protein KatS3mg111_2476 [Pirellulaceae bacterium]